MLLPGASSDSPTSAMSTFSGRMPTQPSSPSVPLTCARSAGMEAIAPLHVDLDDVALASADGALDQVGLAEEVGHEGGLRVVVELGGGAHLLDHARVHHRDGVGHGHGLFLVVRHVHEGQPDLGLDALDLDLHGTSELQVESAERLVEQQHLGTVDQGPGEGDALLLAAGELGRLLARLGLELDEVEHLADLPCRPPCSCGGAARRRRSRRCRGAGTARSSGRRC